MFGVLTPPPARTVHAAAAAPAVAAASVPAARPLVAEPHHGCGAPLARNTRGGEGCAQQEQRRDRTTST
eukprot:gene6546-3836_t